MDTTYPAAQPSEPRPNGTVKECDIVMKGGITSGVVYPAAVLQLKDQYRFVNVGGASAGAIAAVVTAAAEYRRQTDGSTEGFAVLEGVMREVVQDGFVQNLFQPTPASRPLYDVLIASLKSAVPPSDDGRPQRAERTRRRRLRNVLPVLRVLWRQQRPSRLVWAFIGAAVWALLLLAGWGLGLVADPDAWGWSAILGAVTGLLVGIAVGSVVGFLLGTSRTARQVYRALNETGFGMCPGQPQPGFQHKPALTDWLHKRIQACAGPSLTRPLTFGDLKQKGIHLETITTDLTLARPVRIPFESERYLFRPSELRAVFPDEVVNYMIDPSAPLDRPAGSQSDEDQLVEMPAAQDTPLVVFARLSLSFPVLLTAVRLYSIDPAQPEAEALPHWLSDGGIGSNFPIHFFDGWLPGRPTFGLNLGAYPHSGRGAPDAMGETTDVNRWASADVWLATTPEQSQFRRRVPVPSLVGFFGQILDTMQNWRDTIQAELPGFWDRVCEIRLRDDEGGLNLTMPAITIERLIAKGEKAGQTLRDRFNWEQHQFTRYRMLMATLQRRLRGDNEHPGVQERYESFGTLLRSGILAAPYYREGLEKEWFSRADAGTLALLETVGGWDHDTWGDPRAKIDFTIQSDAPTWVMRITPKV
jgi:predicted acylesterase/phospholipase RssA